MTLQIRLRKFSDEPEVQCVNKEQLWNCCPTAGALGRRTKENTGFPRVGVRAKHNGTTETTKWEKKVYRIYLDSLGGKIKYYKPSVEVAPCGHAIQKHFKSCPWMFSSKYFQKSLKLDLRAWKGIRVYLPHFTIHIKTVIMPWKYVGGNKTQIPFFWRWLRHPNGEIFALLTQKKGLSVHNFLVCVYFLRQPIKENKFLRISSFLHIWSHTSSV